MSEGFFRMNSKTSERERERHWSKTFFKAGGFRQQAAKLVKD